MPAEKEIIINDFIKEIIKTNRKCNHCENCHNPNTDDTFCFFAYECLTRDFDFFNEGDD
jgi:hypothetical protein